MFDEHENLFILCLRDNFKSIDSAEKNIGLFYNKDTTVDELKSQSKFVTLLQGPISLVKIPSIKRGLVSVDSDLLNIFNDKKYQLPYSVLVFLMLETESPNVQNWLNLYNRNNDLSSFIKLKIFSSYYNLNDANTENSLISLLENVEDFQYWTNEKNCLHSDDETFKNRKFNLKFKEWTNLTEEEINTQLDKVIKEFYQDKDKLKKYSVYPGEDGGKSYVTMPDSVCRPSKSIDTQLENKQAKIQIKKYKSFFTIVQTSDMLINFEHVNELLTGISLTPKEKYLLICNLLVSKSYVHYILNNKTALETNRELFEKFKPIFKYLMGYAWFNLYTEERLKKTRIHQSDRFVFDIDTATYLPIYPFSSENPYQNPYFCLPISESLINGGQHIGGVEQSVNHQNGIVGLSEFKRRLNIFVSGRENVDLFDGMDWSNMVVTGGVMSAIIPKTNPLMLLFRNFIDKSTVFTESELNRFFQEFYAKSDIDIACNHTNVIDFIDNVKILKVYYSKT